jgi:Cysteine rich repeat
VRRKIHLAAIPIALAALLATALVSTHGWAQSPPSGGAAKRPASHTSNGFGPCSDDVQQFCQDVKVGQGRIAKCLQQHEAQLTAACRAYAKQKRAEFTEAKSACTADAKRLCPEVKAGQGRVAACLKGHEADLSPACRDEFPK